MAPELGYVAVEADEAIPELEEAAGRFQQTTAELGFGCPAPELEQIALGLELGQTALGFEQVTLDLE